MKQIISTHAFESWPVRPQLQNVVVTIVGANLAAEAFSDIMFEFTPVKNAVTMRVEALSPAEFKFDSATVDPPYVLDYATENNVIVLNQMNLIAGVRVGIKVKNVQLGRDGGWTRWNLKTYGTELRVGETPEERVG